MSDHIDTDDWRTHIDRCAALGSDGAHVSLDDLSAMIEACDERQQLRTENSRLRMECVGSLTDAGIFMLAAPHDPTAHGEVPSAIKRLAQQRDAALAEAAAHKAEVERLRGLLHRWSTAWNWAKSDDLNEIDDETRAALAATPTAKEVQ